MSLFLYKPHVTGPEGAVTTPDVVIDRVFVNGALHPLGLLTSDAWQQAPRDDTGRAGYALVALGGGALIAPVLALASGPLVVARAAWRLSSLSDHADRVTLNGAPLSTFAPPADAIAAAGGTDDALPRGYMLIRTAPGDTTEAQMYDPERDRALTHRVTLEPMEQDRWGDARPRPRYSVGPTQKDVTHYI